jgi:hypothetical protein
MPKIILHNHWGQTAWMVLQHIWDRSSLFAVLFHTNSRTGWSAFTDNVSISTSLVGSCPSNSYQSGNCAVSVWNQNRFKIFLTICCCLTLGNISFLWPLQLSLNRTKCSASICKSNWIFNIIYPFCQ